MQCPPPPPFESSSHGSQVPEAERHALQKQVDGAWMFMLIVGKMHVGLEIGEVGSVRYLHEGRRRVAMLPLSVVLDKMGGVSGKKGFGPVRDWLLALKEEDLQGLSKERAFFMELQLPGEALYVPPAWIACEVAEDRNAAGWRTGVVTKGSLSLRIVL